MTPTPEQQRAEALMAKGPVWLVRRVMELEEVLRLFADVSAWSMPEEDAERFGPEAGPWYFDPETDDGNETPWDLALAATQGKP